MAYEPLSERPEEVFHYTKRENMDSIRRDRRIRRFGDSECWFCPTLEDTLELMRMTVMCEGKPYYKVDGSLGFYPEFDPNDYVILKLQPKAQSGAWVRWLQEVPSGSPPELVKAARRFSMLKIGFRGDMRFRGEPEIIEVSPLFRQQAAPTRTEQKPHF